MVVTGESAETQPEQRSRDGRAWGRTLRGSSQECSKPGLCGKPLGRFKVVNENLFCIFQTNAF